MPHKRNELKKNTKKYLCMLDSLNKFIKKKLQEVP